jgi:hypothetical protein
MIIIFSGFELNMKSEKKLNLKSGWRRGEGWWVRLSELLDRFPDIIGYSPPVSLTMPNQSQRPNS